MMTGRERVIASMRGEETDRLCWSPLIDGYYTSSLGSQGYGEKNVAEAVRLTGGDIMERHCPTIRAVDGGSIVRRSERNGNVWLDIVETPIGELRSEKAVSASGHTSFVSKHPIATVEDVKVYSYIMEHRHYEENYEALDRCNEIIGDDGIATSSGPLTPIQDFLQWLCGVENTIYLLVDHQEEVEACFNVMHESNIEAYRLICGGNSEVVIDYEDTSSTVINPDYYDRYCAGLIDDYAAICHDAGKLYLTHMCGKLSLFNEQLRRGKQDGIDSVCPPTTGDIWSYQAREAWGEEKIIVGGIEPPALERMSAAETEGYVRDILEKMDTFRRFILSTGDATAHGTPMDNLRAVTRVVGEYGWK